MLQSAPIAKTGRMIRRPTLETERKALLAMRRMQKEGKNLRTIATAMQERGFAISHQGVKKSLHASARTGSRGGQCRSGNAGLLLEPRTIQAGYSHID
jgi:hypothetical protein